MPQRHEVAAGATAGRTRGPSDGIFSRWLRRAPGRGLALAVFLVAALGVAASAQQPVAEPLVLRPGDAVRVEIRDEPDLTAEYPVSESGQVLFPIIGRVRVADRPWTEVSAELDAAYGRELANPDARRLPRVGGACCSS